jgi:hypothetical protein
MVGSFSEVQTNCAEGCKAVETVKPQSAANAQGHTKTSERRREGGEPGTFGGMWWKLDLTIPTFSSLLRRHRPLKDPCQPLGKSAGICWPIAIQNTRLVEQ